MRERGYDRVEIDRKNVNVLSGFNLPGGIIWAYIPKDPTAPTKEFPIRQSYIDVIISGCLEIGRGFTEDFIKGTSGWNTIWVDDRQRPYYSRAEFDLDVKKIDDILTETIPDEISKRKIDMSKSLF